MKMIIGLFVLAISINASAFELSKEVKAVAASKSMYSLNITSAHNTKFTASKAICESDDTVETCVINVELQEKNQTPGEISYKATFINSQLSSIEQVCRYCW